MGEFELKKLRKLREKHFLQQDGTIKAVLYNEDVHYLEDGKYFEFDNNILEDKNCYQNLKNPFKVKFSKDLKRNLIDISSDEHFLKLELKGAKKELNIKKNMNKIYYKNILENVDIDYSINNRKLKENIILKNKLASEHNLVFLVDTDLTLIVEKNGSIGAYNNSTKIYNIEPVYMFDSNNMINHNVSYKLELKDDKYEITLLLDKEWLTNEETLYPVTIDPTIEYATVANIDDTCISSNITTAMNEAPVLVVGMDGTLNNGVINRSLIKFTLPDLPSSSMITSASVILNGYVNYNELYPDEQIIDVHEITCDWSGSTAIWDNMNDKYNSKIEDNFRAVRSISTDDRTTTSINITNLVKKWYNGTPNYGIMLKAHDESEVPNLRTAMFSATHTEGANYGPILEITYIDKRELDDVMSYRTNEFANGSSKVNVYDGNLSASFRLGRTNKSSNSVELSLLYNTYDISNGNNYKLPLGWKFNYYQKINIISESMLEYIDQNGIKNYFYLKNFEDEEIVFFDFLINFAMLFLCLFL